MRLFLSLGNFERATLTVYSHAATRRIGIEAMVITFIVATTRYEEERGERGGSASIRRGDKSSEATLAEFSFWRKSKLLWAHAVAFSRQNLRLHT